MTNELEKQFFDTFGIEPKHIFRGCKLGAKYYAEICDETTCNGCDEEIRKTEYPTITDRILLELICILTEWRQYCASDYIIKAINIDILKNDILKDCLYMSNWYEFKKCGKDIKHQVRTLFEEGN